MSRPRMLTECLAEMVTYMKVSHRQQTPTSLALHTDSFAGSRQGMPTPPASCPSTQPQRRCSARWFDLTHCRSAVSSLLTSATSCPSPTRTSSAHDVPRGALSPRSSRRRSQRALRSTLAPSATTARRSRPSSSRSARMSSTSSTSPSSPRPSLASPRSSTTRCTLKCDYQYRCKTDPKQEG